MKLNDSHGNYTALYDAVVHRVDPEMKFVGMALAETSAVPLEMQEPRFFE